MADGTIYHAGTHATQLAYHGLMIGDPFRMVAYERALRELVRPGDVVLDLGAGTGVLSMYAARRGARVHAVESGPVAQVMRSLIRRNRLEDRITVHEADFRDLPVVEPVDLVVSDFMGRFVVDDGMLGAFYAARKWLKPEGRFCPGRVELFLAPLCTPVPGVEAFSSDTLGLDVRPALRYTWNTCYAAQFGPPSLLHRGKSYHVFEPPHAPPEFDATLTFDIPAPTLLTSFAGWFVAEMAEGVLLDTGPGVQSHWGQYLFPVPRTPLEAGDRIEIRLGLVPPFDDPHWRWEGRVVRDGADVVTWDLTSDQRLGERDLPDDPLPEPLNHQQILEANDAAAKDFVEGHLFEAIERLETAVRSLAPEDDEIALSVYENLGLARYNVGDHEGAIRALLRALDGDPGRSFQACRILVDAMHQSGRIHDAATWLRTFREHHGEHPEFPSRVRPITQIEPMGR